MSEKYGVQGDESEVDGRNSHQRNKDISNDRNSKERFKPDEDESTIIMVTRTMKKSLGKSTVM